MVMPGFAIAHSIASTGGTMPMINVTLSRPEASLQQDVWRGPIVVLQYENTGTSSTLARTPTAAITTTQLSGVAKTYALVLSTIGMMSLISLLRLTRSSSLRTA
jgi:hypothetical protein